MRRFATLLLALALGACGTPIANIITTGNSSGIPTPSVGKWVAFGGAEPSINGSSWAIPCCNGSVIAGYFYTQLPSAPKPGQTLSVNFSFTGSNPVFVQAPASGGNSVTDTNPPTIHLMLWRKGDNLVCDATTKQYRMFAGRTPLVFGSNQTVSVLLDPSIWTGCYANLDTAANFSDLLSNLLGVGITFGGQSFAGHGIYLSSGNAQFTVNSITVK